MLASWLIVVIGLAVISLLITQKRKSSNGLRSLPGPRGIPYIGVPHKLDPTKPFLQLHEWSKTYGPIYQTQVMGSQLVVVTSRKIIRDFLAKNKASFGNRPSFPGVAWHGEHDMVYLGVIKRADKSRYARRVGGVLMSAMPREQLVSCALSVAKATCLAIQANPDDAKAQTEIFASSVTCTMIWGDSSLATATQNKLAQWLLGKRMAPGGSLESKLPFLQHFANLLPNTLQPWKRDELSRRVWERKFWTAQYQKGIRTMSENGTWTMAGHAALVASEDEKMRFPSDEFAQPGAKGDVIDLVGTLALIGGVLLAVPIQHYLIAMCNHPEWQERAAQELDRVCPNRLPVPDDLPDLPTVRAVIREVNRWRPAVPGGAPHCSEVEHNFEGYSIPAGANVVMPVRSLERDPDLYPDADSFRPERWLEEGWPTFRQPLKEYPKIKGDAEFGWGSRMCLGADYAPVVNAVLIAVLMKTIIVSKGKDEVSGEEIEVPTMNYEPHTIFAQLKPWRMEARARGPEALQCLIG